MKSLAVLMAGCFAVAGCGGSDGGVRVDETKVVNTLSTDELSSMCKDVVGIALEKLGKGDLCKLAGVSMILLGQTEAQCKEMVSMCSSMPTNSGSGDCSEIDKEKAAQCTATVKEIYSCINDSYAATKLAVANLSCSSTKTDVETAMAATKTPPASCTALETKCPGFLEQQSSS